jgi:hypothetical protein
MTQPVVVVPASKYNTPHVVIEGSLALTEDPADPGTFLIAGA